MDEPMESAQENEQPFSKQNEEKCSKLASILRPGSMVMMTITVQDYETEYWPKLEGAINQLLTMAPREYIPISYEQMYSCVYKCVCKQFSERLYNDLLQYMKMYLDRVSNELQSLIDSPLLYIEKFNEVMTQYIVALSAIVPIFNYMNRFYVENKLHTDLNVELRKIFSLHVAEKHVPLLLPLMMQAQTQPFAIKPETMSNLVTNIFSFNEEFAKLEPQLFAQYIPNILPASCEQDLDRYVEETKHMQQELIEKHGFTSGDQSRKRSGEEEAPKPAPLSCMAIHMNHNAS